MRIKYTDIEKPTQKQLDFIADIQEFCGNTFTGKTKQDASKYIDENIERYKLTTISTYVLDHGYF